MYGCVLALLLPWNAATLCALSNEESDKGDGPGPFSSFDKRVFTALLSDPFSIVDARTNPLEKRTCDSVEHRYHFFSRNKHKICVSFR